MKNIQTILLEATATILSQIAIFLPNIIGAFVVFGIGITFSNWIQRLTTNFISRIKLDKIIKHTSIKKFIKTKHIPSSLEELISQTVKWIILLIFFMTSMNLLGLNSVSQAVGQILAYVPNVISAVLIIAFGIIIAGIAESVVKTAITNLNGKATRLLGKVTSYTIIIITILAALAELKIAQQFIQLIFSGFVVTISITLGLSLGLGSKETVSKIINKWYQDSQK